MIESVGCHMGWGSVPCVAHSYGIFQWWTPFPFSHKHTLNSHFQSHSLPQRVQFTSYLLPTNYESTRLGWFESNPNRIIQVGLIGFFGSSSFFQKTLISFVLKHVGFCLLQIIELVILCFIKLLSIKYLINLKKWCFMVEN